MTLEGITMDIFYLLNFRISGIKNIEQRIEIPFYKKTIKNDFNPERYRIKGIYGENGSGKTAIMIAVRILTRIILDRNYLNDTANQKFLVENINKKTGKVSLEAEFYTHQDMGPFIWHYRVDLEIRIDGRVYISRETFEKKIGHNSQGQYLTVFETRNGNLHSLWSDGLFEFSRNRTQNLLEQRSFATFVYDIENESSRNDKECRQLFTLARFASRIHVETDGEDSLQDDLYRKRLTDNDRTVLRETEDLTVYGRASSHHKDQNEPTIPRSKLLDYRKEISRLAAFIRIFKTDLKDIRVEAKEYGEFYICRRVMVYEGYELDEEYESRGIRKLMGLFNALDAACDGGIVFIDELDSNINDVYLNKLIEYFVRYGKGQLCFTAHNLSPMSVLRRSKCAISFISGINTMHTWTSNGNQNPENAYRDGFIEDSPFNVDASDFLGILGGSDD